MEAAHRRIPCPAAALFSSPSPLFLPFSQLELQLGGVPVREYTHAISCARRSLSLPAHAQLTFPLRAQGTGGFFFSRVHPPPALAASVRRLGDDFLREATP